MKNIFKAQRIDLNYDIKESGSKSKRKFKRELRSKKEIFSSLDSKGSSKSIRIHQIYKTKKDNKLEAASSDSLRRSKEHKFYLLKGSSRNLSSTKNKTENTKLQQNKDLRIFNLEEVYSKKRQAQKKQRNTQTISESNLLHPQYIQNAIIYKNRAVSRYQDHDNKISNYFNQRNIPQRQKSIKIDKHILPKNQKFVQFQRTLQKQMQSNGFNFEVTENLVEQGKRNRGYRRKMKDCACNIIVRVLKKKVCRKGFYIFIGQG